MQDGKECQLPSLQRYHCGGQLRSNQNQSNRMSRKRAIKVLDSANGRGVFAQRQLKKDEVVGQVRGEITNDDEQDPRYLMELDGDLLLRPKAPFRYLNHSCNPNCELFVWDDDDEPANDDEPRTLYVGVLRTIPEGGQLTIDYAWPANFAIPCNCKSSKCRGWIVDAGQVAKVKKS